MSIRSSGAQMLRKVLIAAFGFLAVTAADAATLISTASGSIGTTATWSVVDTTGTNAFLNSETGNAALTTSPVASSTFTPAAETVTSIGVKLASVAAVPSGTLTVKLANSTSPGSRECTQTVNVADLVSAAAATAEGGWAILTCSASPNGTDSYTVTANTSVAAMVNLFSLATTNWSRLLVTSGTQASGPAAGDKFYVFGQLTGAGTHNAYAVTIDTTALVNYGNVANTLVDPSIAVGQYGTLQFASAASTAYVSEFAGPMVVYNGGTYSVGTAGTPIPATGSATLTLNSTVEGDTGINVRNGGTMNVAGSSGGRNVVKTLLNTTANAAATSLTVADSTGWLSGDSIIVAGTVTTAGSDATSRWDAVSLTGNASGTTLAVGALTNQHTATALSYTSASTGTAYSMNMYAAVINLTRNVVIQGSGSTTNGYLYFQANANGAITWTQFSQISGSVANKRGIEVDVGPNGSFSLTNSSIINAQHSCLVLAPTNNNFGGTSGSYLTIQHVVMYNCVNTVSSTQFWYGLGILTPVFNPFWKIDDFTVVRTGYASNTAQTVWVAAQSGQFTNITVTGSGSGGVGAFVMVPNYSGAKSSLGGSAGNAWGPINLYANVGHSWTNSGSYGVSGTISGLYIWHEQGRFYAPGPTGNELVIDPLYIITDGFGIYVPNTSGSRMIVRNGVIGWDSNASGQAFPLTMDATTGTFIFDNMDICPVGALGGVTFVACAGGNNDLISLMHDISPGGGYTPSQSSVFLRNSSLLNNLGTKYPTMQGEESYYGATAAVMQDCNACTSPAVKHNAWVPGGFLSYDTAISHSGGYSLRMTPKVLTFSGYISTGSGSTSAGTVLTVTSGPTTTSAMVGDFLYSNGGGFTPGTTMTSGSGSSLNVSQSQSVGSAGAPTAFQSYYNRSGSLLRLQSAPYGQGAKVAVASGQAAQACAWIRPSINTDAAPPWGTAAVTYNGDNPRMIVRANPYMGVQADTVIGTSTPTAGAWSQFCATLPTAPADGEFEVVIDADQTFTSNAGGSVNVTEWSCTNCGSANGSQFWWNGVPSAAIAPVSSSGGGSRSPHVGADGIYN